MEADEEIISVNAAFHLFHDNLLFGDVKTGGNKRIVGGCQQVVIGSIFVGRVKGSLPEAVATGSGGGPSQSRNKQQEKEKEKDRLFHGVLYWKRCFTAVGSITVHESIPVDKSKTACYAIKFVQKEQENNTISLMVEYEYTF